MEHRVKATIARCDAVMARLEAAADLHTAPVRVWSWDVPGEPIPPSEALAGADFRPTEVGATWGPAWGTTWFRFEGDVPRDWAGRQVELHVDLGYTPWPPGFQAEGLAVTADGRPVRGLHPRARRILLPAQRTGAGTVVVHVEAAANPSVTSFTVGGAEVVNRIGGPGLYRLTRAGLACPAVEVRACLADLDVARTLLSVALARRVGDERVTHVADACDAACDRLAEAIDDSAASAARALLRPVLTRPSTTPVPTLSVVGHAHLDTAWLWPVRETVRKVVRTYANVLALMDGDADVTFAGSQAVHHAWVEDRHPELFARIVERAGEGRWVPVGGMWVESDVLLPSGESLVRQLAHGQRYFLERFGRAARTGWLPDCFGYSPALPQLLRAAGIDGFVTQKLSWNDTNRFPHHTFWWEGLDGSRVLAHFPTVSTYNAELSADDVERALAPAPSGQPLDDTLVPMGYGDGGGGPTAEMLERVRRMRDVDGLPPTRFVDPDTFVERRRDDDLPVWRGDLYLETHRGVWTSQRETKLGDARVDEALREAESWCAAAAVTAGAAYPFDTLDGLWKRHLLLEFHDILPGTSITRVHREAEAEHDDVLAAALRLRDGALAVLGGRPRPTASPPVRPVATPAGGAVLDNGLVRGVVAPTGALISLVDLATGHDVLATGQGLGTLHLHDDRPTVFDAWNLDRSYLEASTTLESGALSVGPDGVAVRVPFGGSSALLTWSLPSARPSIRLTVELDWQERDRILKLAMPFALAADDVLAGVQHGLVARSLVDRSSWAQARYEDWFHGFLCLDDGDAGVALVTADCHGYDASRDGAATTLRLSLVRGPRFPDPDCDLGRHRFDVDVVVGRDVDAVARTARAARRALVPAAADEGVEPLVVVEGRGVVVDAVKLADDGSGDVVVRLNECLGDPVDATLRCRIPVASAVRCDLLERPLASPAAAPAPQTTLTLSLRPFEVVTLRLRLRPTAPHPPTRPDSRTRAPSVA